MLLSDEPRQHGRTRGGREERAFPTRWGYHEKGITHPRFSLDVRAVNEYTYIHCEGDLLHRRSGKGNQGVEDYFAAVAMGREDIRTQTPDVRWCRE